jgi:hypothetical protein
VYDSFGNLVRNVGGDYKQPHRPSDPVDRVFLDGNLLEYTRGEIQLTIELVNQIWFDVWYIYELSLDNGRSTRDKNHTGGFRVRTEF